MNTHSSIVRRLWAVLGGLFCVGLLALLPGFSQAQTTAPRATPTTVDIGVYLNNIPSVNLKEKKFQADFNLWFRWTGDAINPPETFELINAQINSKDGRITKKIGDVNYGMYRIVATFYRNFSLSRYPLDDHPLKIQIEDIGSSSADVIFRADKIGTGLSPKVDVPGWTIGKFESYTSVTRYNTHFGDISKGGGESSYPRFTLAVELKRAGWGNFIKLFSMLFLATALAFCALRVRADHIDARIALAASGVFLAVLTQNTLSTNLPESESFGMADQLYFLTMGFIVLVFLACIYTFKLIMGGHEAKADSASHRIGILLPVAYVAAVATIVASA